MKWLAKATVIAVAPLVFAVGPDHALAHGPCGCLDPVLAQVNGRVRITGGPGRGQANDTGWPVYKAIFNPAPRQLGIAPDYLGSAYRADVPSITVLSRSRRNPTQTGAFRVPRVPAGLYMVLIFDGSEGGAHNTWDYLHVFRLDEPARPVFGERIDRSAPRPLLVSLLAATIGLGAGIVFGRYGHARHRRKRGS